jgi:hypothetical protein
VNKTKSRLDHFLLKMIAIWSCWNKNQILLKAILLRDHKIEKHQSPLGQREGILKKKNGVISGKRIGFRNVHFLGYITLLDFLNKVLFIYPQSAKPFLIPGI